MTIWWVVIGCIVVTAVIKAAGPVALGGRDLPTWFSRLVVVAAPALLAALVATSIFAQGQRWSVGAHTIGVLVASVILWRRGSIVLAVFVAVAITATLRALA